MNKIHYGVPVIPVYGKKPTNKKIALCRQPDWWEITDNPADVECKRCLKLLIQSGKISMVDSNPKE